jgi:hypothetical protein
MPPDVFFEILTAPSTRPDKQPLSTVNSIATVEVHHSGPRHGAYEGNSWRNVWIPYSSESSSWKGFQAMFLLANGDKRCRADCQDLQSLSVRSQAPAKARGSIVAHHSNLAVTTLGNGHRWTTTNDPRQFQVRCGRG